MALAALAQAAAAGAAPFLSDPALSPSAWNSSPSASVAWVQNDFGGGLDQAAVIETRAADGAQGPGGWEPRASIPGPLVSGSNGILGVDVSDLEGRHQARVVIDGAANSPLTLGTLQLDRTPPVAASVWLSPAGGAVVADWIQSDTLSGTDPGAPVVAEVNASPAGDAAGPWLPFDEQPAPGDGRKLARTSLAGLPDGRHLVRARSRDRAGNVGVHPLGTVTSDATAPSIGDVRVARPPVPGHPVVELAFRADDGPGVGVAGGAAAGPAGRAERDWTWPGASGPDRVMVRLPWPGVHLVSVRVTDRVGNRGESAAIAVRVPSAAELADARVPAPARVAGPGARPGPRVAWAYARVRRFHAGRGLRLDARLGVARTTARWGDLLGAGPAARYRGYATLQGRVLIGPAATAGLEVLGAARAGRGPRPSRADLDRAALGLAVLLHESLHATGPVPRDDVLRSRSGRAFEEGFTEAATLDLLPRLVATLDLPAPLRARLRAAATRHRPAYGPEVAWARRMSARATGAGARSPRARAWRIRVADRWGSDRWARLAAATGVEESALRAGAGLPPGRAAARDG